MICSKKTGAKWHNVDSGARVSRREISDGAERANNSELGGDHTGLAASHDDHEWNPPQQSEQVEPFGSGNGAAWSCISEVLEVK